MNYAALAQKIKNALKTLPTRYQKVVHARYGINEEPKTLEDIGESFGVTRERIRQMEVKALEDLRAQAGQDLAPCFRWVSSSIDREGGIVAEPHFLDCYGKAEKGALLLTLYLGEDFLRGAATPHLHHHWYTDEELKDKALEELKNLMSHFEEKNALLDQNELHSHVTNLNYLNVCKVIALSPLGAYGLTHWSEVIPKGVKDKAYIVLKQAQKPLHFLEITERINSLAVDGKKALKQTVHNELIKDKRFVLVGRGLYGLNEWGFRAGTVKDILKSIFEEKGIPLKKEEVIPLVLKERFVQENTILLNLNNGGDFVRLRDGRYALKN